jgi:hemoglobin
MRRFLTFILLISIVSTLFGNDAEARRRRHRKAKRPAIINEKKLYERIGGTKTLSSIVDEWMRLNLADQRIAPFFSKLTAQPEKLGKMRHNLNDQICELADGPCQYRGAEMKKAHKDLTINEEQFLVFSDNLFRSMQKFNVPEREKNELLARLSEVRSEIVDTPPSASGNAASAQ